MLDREQRVKKSATGYPNREVPQWTFSHAKHCLVHINCLETNYQINNYVDDSTIFKLWNQNKHGVCYPGFF